jgi:hypothetical protein
MSIEGFVVLKRPIILILLPAFLSLMVGPPVAAQDQQKGEGRIENARWLLDCDVVIITYDLVANPELVYDVNIVLKRESDKEFKLVPKSVSGAVGKGKFAGTKREIRWEYKKDVGDVLSGDDYHFDFAVFKEEGISTVWYYVIAGVVGGGAAASQLFRAKQASGGGSPTVGLPVPPSSQPGSH